MLSEFPYKLPVCNPKPPKPTSDDDAPEEAPTTSDDLEECFLRDSVLLSLEADSAANRVLDASDRIAIAKRENAIDRALLQLLMLACKDEAMGARALEICGLFKQRRTLEMAGKVALKYERTMLAGKIAELRDEMEVEDD